MNRVGRVLEIAGAAAVVVATPVVIVLAYWWFIKTLVTFLLWELAENNFPS